MLALRIGCKFNLLQQSGIDFRPSIVYLLFNNVLNIFSLQLTHNNCVLGLYIYCMHKKFLLLTVAVLSSIILFSQKLSTVVNYVTDDGTANSNIIVYQPGQMLSWDDFKGAPVEGHEAAAMTNAGLAIKLAFHRDGNTSQLVLAVSCNFSRKDSWVKKGNKNSYILNHEQKHFDIAYIHTLMFMQALKNASFTTSNYVAEIQKIYRESVTAMATMQNQYDTETSHSRITEKQAGWDEKISELLVSSGKL
jgi:hypothetical protein